MRAGRSEGFGGIRRIHSPAHRGKAQTPNYQRRILRLKTVLGFTAKRHKKRKKKGLSLFWLPGLVFAFFAVIPLCLRADLRKLPNALRETGVGIARASWSAARLRRFRSRTDHRALRRLRQELWDKDSPRAIRDESGGATFPLPTNSATGPGGRTALPFCHPERSLRSEGPHEAGQGKPQWKRGRRVPACI